MSASTEIKRMRAKIREAIAHVPDKGMPGGSYSTILQPLYDALREKPVPINLPWLR